MLLKNIEQENKYNDNTQVYYEVTVMSPIEEVWDALTSSEKINKWGGGPARIQRKINGDYSLWDGEMQGVIQQIEKPTKLVHTLERAIWDSAHISSIVEWTLEESDRGTKIILNHSKLPTQQAQARHKDGWGEYFLGPLKYYLNSYL